MPNPSKHMLLNILRAVIYSVICALIVEGFCKFPCLSSTFTHNQHQQIELKDRNLNTDQAVTERNRTDRPMKFGKLLKQQVEKTLPEWRDKFLSYKDLKKLVRLIAEETASALSQKAEAEFVYQLNNEIDKFNSFFMEQEEDFIIRHKELQQRIKRAMNTLGANGTKRPPEKGGYEEEIERIRKAIVNFHGEMVLLENYSNINYTGLAKILKKYDKRTGGLMRLPFIQKVLEQPFFTTDQVSKLVKECEVTIERMFPEAEKQERENMTEMMEMEMEMDGGGIFRNTVAALLTMQEIRRGSSTYSNFSLPPLNLPDSDLVRYVQLTSPVPIL